MNFGRHCSRYAPYVCNFDVASAYFVKAGLEEVGSKNGDPVGVAAYPVSAAQQTQDEPTL